MPVLVCRSLTKTYPGPVPVTALRDASFTVHRGEMAAIVGRSGSGKSTLLTLMGLLDRPTSGRLEIQGVDTAGWPSKERDHERRSRIGFVFQSFNLIPELSALDNVALALRYQGVARRDHRERSTAALERVGLAHRVRARVRTLSGGEQQRVALARSLVKRPAVILADEPTGNLDSTNEGLVIDLLRAAADGGTAVVVVTHSPVVAGHADRALTMHDGVVTDHT